MKKLYTLIAMLLLTACLFAQAPQKMNFQAVVRNASNSLVADQNVSARISILQGSATGVPVYSETHSVRTNANGLMTLEIGGGNIINGSFSAIDWADGPFFIKSEIDPEGGINYSVTTTQQLMSVPFALFADKAANTFSGNYEDLSNKPEIPTVPSVVSAFANDAKYITAADVPAQVNADWNATSGTAQILNKPKLFSGDYNDLQNKPTLFDGNYNSLVNKPVIPTVPTNVSVFNNDAKYITAADVPAQVNADWNATSGTAQILNKPKLFSGDYNDLQNKPSLFDGNYNSLINKPAIPTVPTNVSVFNNDAKYITAADVPANVSQLNNDAGYVSNSNCPTVDFCELYSSLNHLQTSLSDMQDELSNMRDDMDSLQNVIASQDSIINALNEELHPNPAAVPDSEPCLGTPTVTDYDGNVYHTVKIGNQCWIRENVRSTHYSDGTEISLGTDTSSTTAYRYYPNNSNSNVETCGYLYNWNAVMHDSPSSAANPSDIQGICPEGWHVPSYAEWKQLVDYVGSQGDFVCDGQSEAIVMKPLSSTDGWESSNVNCAAGNNPSSNNATGFSAYPAGYFLSNVYEVYGSCALFWSTTLGDLYTPLQMKIEERTNEAGTSTVDSFFENGLSNGIASSVRCIRNESVDGTMPAETLPSIRISAVPEFLPMGKSIKMSIYNDGASNVISKGICWSTNQNPTIEDEHISDDSEMNVFTLDLVGLTPNMTYYARAYATNSVGTAYSEQIGFTTTKTLNDGQPCSGTPTVTDHEGNVYNTVQIGNQCWTKENMRCTTSPSTGTNILEPSPIDEISYSYTGKMAYYPNGNPSNVEIHGLLYNWNAAVDTFNTEYGETSIDRAPSHSVSVSFSGNRRGICPQGWHVPSREEWTQLRNYMISQPEYICGENPYNIAKALASTYGWMSESNACAVGNEPSTNNATGFSAVPSGFYSGTFQYFRSYTYIWSVTPYSSTNVNTFRLYVFDPDTSTIIKGKHSGYSVRCLRD